MPCQAEGVGPESVGFNDLRAGLQVVVVDGANQFGLGEIQFVVAAIDKNALRVKQRAHGAVAEHGRLFDSGTKISGHSIRIQDESGFVLCHWPGFDLSDAWSAAKSASKKGFWVCYNARFRT